MDLLNIFPELSEIGDENLRMKTSQALEKAITLGGWSEADLEMIPFTLLIPELVENGRPMISIVEHIRAVTQMCMATYERYKTFGMATKLQYDELIAGAILHDVGKFIEYERSNDGKIVQTKAGKYIRHPALGLELVADLDLPLIVRQAIVFHSKEGDKINRFPEVEIVHRCDFLCFAPIKKFFE